MGLTDTNTCPGAGKEFNPREYIFSLTWYDLSCDCSTRDTSRPSNKGNSVGGLPLSRPFSKKLTVEPPATFTLCTTATSSSVGDGVATQWRGRSPGEPERGCSFFSHHRVCRRRGNYGKRHQYYHLTLTFSIIRTFYVLSTTSSS